MLNTYIVKFILSPNSDGEGELRDYLVNAEDTSAAVLKATNIHGNKSNESTQLYSVTQVI